MTNTELIQGFKLVAEYSKQLEVWAATLFGTTALTVLSTSYIKPEIQKHKIAYFIFIPSWICIGISMYYSDYIQRLVLGAIFTEDHNRLLTTFYKINSSFRQQQLSFYIALISFGLWLLIFLIWWVFIDKKPIVKKIY
jgi:hypothetical protein